MKGSEFSESSCGETLRLAVLEGHGFSRAQSGLFVFPVSRTSVRQMPALSRFPIDAEAPRENAKRLAFFGPANAVPSQETSEAEFFSKR